MRGFGLAMIIYNAVWLFKATETVSIVILAMGIGMGCLLYVKEDCDVI